MWCIMMAIGVLGDYLVKTDSYFHYIFSVIFLFKRPARDACLCMGELPAPPAPHFVFLITL